MAGRSGVVVSGPLEPFVAGFAAELSRQGFAPVMVPKHVRLVAELSGWLADQQLGPSALSLEVAERFCEARVAGSRRPVTVRSLGPLLGICGAWASFRR